MRGWRLQEAVLLLSSLAALAGAGTRDNHAAGEEDEALGSRDGEDVLLLTALAALARSDTRDSHTAGEEDEEDAAAGPRVPIAKCCDGTDVLLDKACVPIGETNETVPWRPSFEDGDSYEGAKPAKEPRYLLKYGPPKCAGNEIQWEVYYYPNSADTLVMLTSGKLRHYIPDQVDEVEKAKEMYGMEFELEDVQAKAIHYDYPFGHYCTDKAVLTKDNLVATYAKICVPRPVKWANTDNLMKKAINPAFHAIGMVSYLVVAIVYFVLPQLRDLVGNIITSMTMCLITNQSASLVRIFTEFENHISFFIADAVMYISLLAAFLWLNALGYYVWNTFRSRNVFLRSTDGRKYCCYSTYVWGSTIAIGATAIFAHFTLETKKPVVGTQETLGRLGLSVLFTMVAFTVIINLCFVLTTINKIKRMRTYGRIHHKMKYSFRMFILIYSIMSIGWIFLLLSLLQYDGLIYCHIIVNVLQALLILYVCVFGQKRVTFLLGKTCNCCASSENAEGLDWGEEMTAINAGY